MESSHHGDFGREDKFSKSGEEKKDFEETIIVVQEFDMEGKALRVIPRGKQWLTVYRAQQVFRPCQGLSTWKGASPPGGYST